MSETFGGRGRRGKGACVLLVCLLLIIAIIKFQSPKDKLFYFIFVKSEVLVDVQQMTRGRKGDQAKLILFVLSPDVITA